MKLNADRVHDFDVYAKFAIAHKPQYVEIETKTTVPWPLIAVLHRRESDANFNTYLGNGDRLDRPTHNVPAGRGPFATFVAGAIDALHLDGLDRIVSPWPIEKMLFECEIFNGAGYDMHGLPSPYIWGGTNQQKPGKYTVPAPVALPPVRPDEPLFVKAPRFDGSYLAPGRKGDGHWNPGMMDRQPGCAPILWTIAKLDPSVIYSRES